MGSSFLPRVVFAFLGSISFARAATNVLTWHNDAARTGQNLTETQLSPANVNSTNFGKLFQINVDGKVDAQPLIVSNVTIPNKGVHNVVIIATEHDTVYCCDADDGTVLWTASMLKTGEVPSEAVNGCGQVSPEIGVTATPVIDLSSGPHGTIYLTAMSKSGSTYIQRLHALDLTTGAEEFSGPVQVVATYPRTGDNSNNGMVVFDPKQYKERAALVLDGNLIYTAWASHCDIRPYTSWVIAYNKTTLAQARVLNLTPNGTHGAIWASGAGPAQDAAGNLYALTGDGTFETTLDANGFPNKSDFGNCIVKLSDVSGATRVTDYWTMSNTVSESNADQDLGSGGALVLPDMLDASAQTRHLVAGAGKDGHIYLADRDDLGKFAASNNATLYQDAGTVLPDGVWAAPAYFNGRLYYGAVNETLKAFSFTNARLNASPVSQSVQTFNYPGATPSISANGTANAIAWATRNSIQAGLFAFDATNLATQLYASTDASGGRDNFGAGNKFITPTIANGKVYVGTTISVGVLGLFNPPHLYDISTRANVGTGENVLIGGFIIRGSASKTLVLRAIGPSLAVNGVPIPGRLADPTLELRDGNGARISSNNDWQLNNPNASQIQQNNLAPADSKESAILATLAPGNYTAILRGANASSGIALVEVYDLSTPPTSNLANLSSRGFVGTANDTLIGGAIVRGVASETVLFRAIGPELGSFGIANPLADPMLNIRDANGTQIASNDNWKTTQQSAIVATGLQPANDNDAAVLITLTPGNYTALVSGAGGSTGIALVEAYEIR